MTRKSEFTMVIPAHDFCAASLMRGKAEIRHFIDGVCISQGVIFGTNGHSAYCCTSKFIKMPKGIKTLIVKSKSELAAVTKDRELWVHLKVFADSGVRRYGIAFLSESEKYICPIKTIPIEVFLDEGIPDVRRIIKKTDSAPAKDIGINLNLTSNLAKVQKIFSKYGCTMTIQGKDDQIRFTFPSAGNAAGEERVGVVMPMRL